MDPFVERTGELRRLREWTAEVAATGVGRLVLVTGEAGAGKTRLCEELMGSVAGPDLAVAWSRCATFGQHLPLWPWPDVVRELAYQQGQERCEDQETPAHARDRYTLYQSVADRLRELCADRPAAVLIDDLHIAANESILLTQMVSGLLHRFPLLLVVTWRLDAAHFTEPSCPLASLAREASTIELLPFGCREVTEYLINTGHPRPGPEVVSRLLVQSGGNPMYLAELAQHDPSTAEDTHVVGMVRALARKVGRIDSAQRRFLGAVAVLGDGAALDEVAAVGGTSVQTVAATLDGMASGARVIDGRVHFSHELLRQAFLSALSDEEQLRFHVAAMEAVSGPAPERTVRRAGHAIAAATLSNEHREAAVLACLRAGQNLHTALAFESAASWAATGTRLADGSVAATTRAELLLLEAAASSSAGRAG